MESVNLSVYGSESLFTLFSTDSDYENANRSADVDVELMAFQSIIGDDYKGHKLLLSKRVHRHTDT